MDLRDIQALHAQYTAQPVIIDIASHAAAMPALPAPERGQTVGTRAMELVAGLRKAGKPALVALAIAAVAATGGMSIARIWRAMHETAATPPVVAASSAPNRVHLAASEPTGDMPINVTPPHPLTSSDFDSSRPATQSALSNVDTRALSGATTTSPADHAAPVARAVEQSVAAASPIRAQRPTVPTTAPVATPSSSPSLPSQSSPTATAAVAQVAPPVAPQTRTPVAAPAAAPEAEKSSTRPALRPLHHITRHPAATAGNENSPEPAAPAQPKAQPGKSGDVQLF
ncbi:hypothetical protein GGD68_006988 [Paraburkholderia fungorum]|jgi:hypothetical protein|uniref:hypothetical protein n=1 Tax=Paraburkholderia fungorum TaxID=134537 RepID=UPI00161CD668|nr:hypothetical protein [Paraburkholderia fungorum]MBB4518182.1 hypothetical protein [Paraburkholderia fungorum]